MNDVVFAPRFAASLAAAVPGGLSAEQSRCVQERFAALPAADVAGLLSSGLEPSKADPGLGERLKQLLTGCGIDPGSVRAPMDPANDGR
ncbi:MAG: hypothetical protein U0Q07_08130 [Acidimicrobiales bacterium]